MHQNKMKCPICRQDATATVKLIYDIKYVLPSSDQDEETNDNIKTTDEIVKESNVIKRQNEILKEQVKEITGNYIGCFDTINTDNKPENPNAEKCLFDMKAQGYQTKVVSYFINAVDSGMLKMLIRKQEQDFTDKEREFYDRNVLPFVNTELLFMEIANLKLKVMSGNNLTVEKVVKKIDKDKFSALSSSFRNKYMLERIFRISMRSVKVLTEHITAGDFLIKGTEVSFKSEDNLSSITFRLSDDEIMKFSGKIDRLDTYEDDEHIYVKIIDYKSGDKNLNLIEIYRGLSLQLVVYMNAATELLNRNSNKEIVPAGILYYHIDDPIVEGLIDEDSDSIADKIKKQLKMKGLVNNDENVYSHIDKDFTKTSDIIPVIKNVDGTLSKKSSAIDSEQFDTISKYVNKKILSIGREILDGNIKAEPHSADSIDSKACSYCPYTDMCRYNGEKAEYSDGVNKENVFDMMKEVISFKEES